ncbi:MAG TPA: hypothetical protein PLF13_11505 [candidate division Zixibacteria bacterium]|nr:hypothetical protein [candidate division Zixibacteria bacterium]
MGRHTLLNNMIKRPTLVVLTLSFLIGIIFIPMVSAEDGDAGQAGEFLRYGVSVRSLGMGRAYVALSDDAGGLFYNAAGLLRAPRKLDGYFMYSRPMGLSTYDFVAFALPRPNVAATGGLGWLYGPETAWGIAGINLSSDEFDLRDENNNLIGDGEFGLYQQALLVGYAREFTGPAGVLGLGMTFKMISQGIRDAGDRDDSDFGFGLDLGAQVQLLSPPLIKDIASLKFLIPLRLGINVQNLVPPSVGFGGVDDDYPTSLRFGWSYAIQGLFGNDSLGLTLANDYEKILDAERGIGVFAGFELAWRLDNAVIAPRAGLNKVGDDEVEPALGAGITWRKEKFDLRLDAAWGHHDRLDDDFRISLTAQFGKRRDSRFFDDDCDPTLSSRNRHLHVVANYPVAMDIIDKAATKLATEEDVPNKRRYYDLIKGYGLAYELAADAQKLFQQAVNTNDSTTAHNKAQEAVREYDKARSKNEHTEAQMGSHNILACGESWLIIGAVAGQRDTSDALTNAERLLKLADVTDESQFLLGTALSMQGKYDEAAGYFASVSGLSGKNSTLTDLSHLKLAECQVMGSTDNSALERTLAVLKKMTEGYHLALDSEYPRYKVYTDMELADDAQLWSARVLMELGREEEALRAVASVCRFYSDKDACGYAETTELMQRLIQKLRR